MSDAARNFLRLRWWLESAYFWGDVHPERCIRLEARLRFEAESLIGWFVTPEGTP